MEVAVVGGGIAGLAAAWDIHRLGVPFVLLEADARWGGVIRTEQADGFLMEGGPDALLAQKLEALRLCRELGLDDRIVPTNPEQRTVFVRQGGRLHRLPDGMVLGVPTRLAPLARTRLFTWTGKLRMAADLVSRADARTGTSRSRRFSGGGWAGKQKSAWARRSWPASTPATRSVSRYARRFRAWSRWNGGIAA